MSSLKTGLNALLTQEESVLVLIDHQPFQFANLNSHEPTMIINNVIGFGRRMAARLGGASRDSTGSREFVHRTCGCDGCGLSLGAAAPWREQASIWRLTCKDSVCQGTSLRDLLPSSPFALLNCSVFVLPVAVSYKPFPVLLSILREMRGAKERR